MNSYLSISLQIMIKQGPILNENEKILSSSLVLNLGKKTTSVEQVQKRIVTHMAYIIMIICQNLYLYLISSNKVCLSVPCSLSFCPNLYYSFQFSLIVDGAAWGATRNLSRFIKLCIRYFLRMFEIVGIAFYLSQNDESSFIDAKFCWVLKEFWETLGVGGACITRDLWLILFLDILL